MTFTSNLKLQFNFVFTLIAGCLITMTACEENGVPNKQLRNIEDYISDNNLTITDKTSEGLHYIRLEEGEGETLSTGDNITVNYKGNLLNGDVFDSGTFSFVLGVGQVVRGFDLGILRMRVGEKAIIIFPSTMGYGNSKQGSIPRNSPLVFEIEVLKAN